MQPAMTFLNSHLPSSAAPSRRGLHWKTLVAASSICALGLAGCQERARKADQAENFATRLKAGDIRLCADKQTHHALLLMATQDLPWSQRYGPYLRDGGPKLPFTLVSATEVKSEIGEISCQANIMVPETIYDKDLQAVLPAKFGETTIQVNWVMRTNVEDYSDVLLTPTFTGLAFLDTYLAAWQRQRRLKPD